MDFIKMSLVNFRAKKLFHIYNEYVDIKIKWVVLAVLSSILPFYGDYRVNRIDVTLEIVRQ